jgi:hypothetical protein
MKRRLPLVGSSGSGGWAMRDVAMRRETAPVIIMAFLVIRVSDEKIIAKCSMVNQPSAMATLLVMNRVLFLSGMDT